MMAVVYINKQGGARSPSLCAEPFTSGTDASSMGSHCTPCTFLADTFSRSFYTNHEWEIHDPMLHSILHWWGTPHWDLFGIFGELQIPPFLLQRDPRDGLVGRSAPPALDLQSLLRLSTRPSAPATPVQGTTGSNNDQPDCPLLASPVLVHRPSPPLCFSSDPPSIHPPTPRGWFLRLHSPDHCLLP